MGISQEAVRKVVERSYQNPIGFHTKTYVLVLRVDDLQRVKSEVLIHKSGFTSSVTKKMLTAQGDWSTFTATDRL